MTDRSLEEGINRRRYEELQLLFSHLSPSCMPSPLSPGPVASRRLHRLVYYGTKSLNNAAYSPSVSHSRRASTSLSSISALLSLCRLQLGGKYSEIGVILSTNPTCSQDEWARLPHADYVFLISAYIKASVETESLTTPSV